METISIPETYQQQKPLQSPTGPQSPTFRYDRKLVHTRLRNRKLLLLFRVKRNVSSISTGHLSEVFEKGKPPKSVSLPRKVIFTEEDMKQLSPQTSLGHSTGPELPISPDITGLSG